MPTEYRSCSRGHLKTPDNIFTYSNGNTVCRKCRYITATRWKNANPEKMNSYLRKYRKAGYSRIKAEADRTKRTAAFKAHAAVARALRKGKLIRPSICERCRLECKPQAHHPDHSKWLEVIWLCRACHLAEHGYTPRVFVPGDSACVA